MRILDLVLYYIKADPVGAMAFCVALALIAYPETELNLWGRAKRFLGID